MAQLPNNRALTVGDGANDYFNVNTILQHVQVLNGAFLRFFSDAYSTRTLDVGVNGSIAPAPSATAPDPGAAGTINTGVGVARVSPAAARTACILQAGTMSGQMVWVINEAVAANSITFDVAGTSNVADGTSDVIAGKTARCFVWDGSVNLWFKVV
jgi:hypothetical protein